MINYLPVNYITIECVAGGDFDSLLDSRVRGKDELKGGKDEYGGGNDELKGGNDGSGKPSAFCQHCIESVPVKCRAGVGFAARGDITMPFDVCACQ